MKIAVIGPTSGRQVLLSLLTRYSESICADVEFTIAGALDRFPQVDPDLAFIYICEQEYDAYLRFLADHPECEVVLWADDDRLARPALRSHPRDFLLLPTSDAQFLNVMKKCRSWKNALRVLSCTGSSAGRVVRCIEVQYVESVGHACSVHCRDEVFTVNRSLSAVQQQLGEGFLRCHRGFVINMRCVTQLGDKRLRLTGREEIPLSPAPAESIIEELWAYRQHISCFIPGTPAFDSAAKEICQV